MGPERPAAWYALQRFTAPGDEVGTDDEPFAVREYEVAESTEPIMSLELTFAERRVLGTLVEKAFTTPQQCPLTLNSLINGCNQKSCRNPVSNLNEEQLLDTLDSLRVKGLTTLVRSSGSQVDRYRQRLAEALDLSPPQTATLAELLLRGAQSDGELRQRASRMVRIDSLPEMGEIIAALGEREQPLAARVTPPGRRRGVKYDHLLYPEGEQPEIEEEDMTEIIVPARSSGAAEPRGASTDAAALRAEVSQLREELNALRGAFEAFRVQVTALSGGGVDAEPQD